MIKTWADSVVIKPGERSVIARGVAGRPLQWLVRVRVLANAENLHAIEIRSGSGASALTTAFRLARDPNVAVALDTLPAVLVEGDATEIEAQALASESPSATVEVSGVIVPAPSALPPDALPAARSAGLQPAGARALWAVTRRIAVSTVAVELAARDASRASLSVRNSSAVSTLYLRAHDDAIITAGSERYTVALEPGAYLEVPSALAALRWSGIWDLADAAGHAQVTEGASGGA